MIDIYYRLVALSKLGIEIHLHCFEYGRAHSPELESLCATVHYYKRHRGFFYFLSALPFIVVTRKSKELLNNLVNNPFPILFEGLHSTFYLNHKQLTHRKKYIRAHNVESMYYKHLALLEQNIFKKIFFFSEALKLRFYEKRFRKADAIFSISSLEQEYFKKRFRRAIFLAPSHPYSGVTILPGKGSYVLYHADLSVSENDRMAKYLIKEIFTKISYPCVVAGKSPSKDLMELAGRTENVQVLANLSTADMQQLLQHAHVHVLLVKQAIGMKLKLLMSLFSGRFCLTNRMITRGTVLEKLCICAETPRETILQIELCMQRPFTAKMIEERKALLEFYFNNEQNARLLDEVIFEGK
jgi:hypothetical protein